MNLRPRPVTLGMLLALVACGPLVQIGGNDKPPEALLTLRAETLGAPSQAIDPARTLSIATPSVPGAIQTLRLPVTVSDTEVQYLKAANWVEQPAKLFQRLLADTAAGELHDETGTLRRASRNWNPAAARPILEHYLGQDLPEIARAYESYVGVLVAAEATRERQYGARD